MNDNCLQAYGYFANVFTSEEKSLINYIYHKLSKKKCSSAMNENVQIILDNQENLNNLNVFFTTIYNFGHLGQVRHICSIILGHTNNTIVKRAQSISGYNSKNKGYISYNNSNFVKSDNSFLGRLDLIKSYVINKIEGFNEI